MRFPEELEESWKVLQKQLLQNHVNVAGTAAFAHIIAVCYANPSLGAKPRSKRPWYRPWGEGQRRRRR